MAGVVTAAIALAGCATGSPRSTPTVDLAPVAAEPATASLEWLAATWGPFDATAVGPTEDGPGGYPLLLRDGVQIIPGTEAHRDMLVDVPDPNSEDANIRVFKHPCDTRHFGSAGDYGIIMIFTPAYDGPIPADRTMTDAARCAGEALE